MSTKTHFLLLFFLTLSQILGQAYETLPVELDGTMRIYDFTDTDAVVPWSGSELYPVGTAYIARHGARFLSSEKKVEELLESLEKARRENTQTSDGESFAQLLDTVLSLSRGRWGDLSPVGQAEEQRLGAEYCTQLPEFSGKIEGSAVSSYVPRVVKTMWDFLYPLAANSKDNEIVSAEGPQFSPLVRYFETDSLYRSYLKAGDWREVYDRYSKETLPTAPARRLFGPVGDNNKLRSLTLDIYGVLQSLRAAGLPGPTTRWMSESEYRSCWEVTNLLHYLQRSLCPLSNDAMIAASPLLQDIIAKTDSVAMRDDSGVRATNANFWFGHAETLLPLTALMNLPGCAALPLDWSHLSAVWKDYEITPLGANILIVLLRDPEAKTVPSPLPTGTPDLPPLRVAVRFNGRWIAPVGGEGLTPLWSSVRGHWLRRIEQIGSGLLE